MKITQLKVSKYLLVYSLAVLLTVLILLVAKGGDSSALAGVILYTTGAISSAISLIITVKQIFTENRGKPIRKHLLLFTLINSAYIMLFLFSAGLVFLLYCSLGN